MINWLRKRIWRTGEPIRGRIHRISRVKGGELSIVIRFGLEEDAHAQRLLQGALVEVFETRDGVPPKPQVPHGAIGDGA